MNLPVVKIPNRGRYQEYPAMKNTETGQVYVDTTLGMPRFLEHGADGLNRCHEFVGFNIPGAWCTWNGEEPVAPLKQDCVFIIPEMEVA